MNAQALRDESERNSPLRVIALRLGLALIFLRISSLHQAEAFLLRVNLRLLYLVGIPAILGTLLCGGIQRSFRAKPVYFWIGYWVWMACCVPMSTWRGNSLGYAQMYLRTNLVMLFVAAGLIMDWKEFLMLMRTIAFGAIATLLLARVFQAPGYQERFGLEFGTVSNPNDFAAHLLLVLPFLYWVVLSSKNWVMKLISLMGIAYGLFLIVQTASRGAFIGISVTMVCLFLMGSVRQKLALALLVPVAVVALVAVVPGQVINRMLSFSSGEQGADQEALESSASREYLLKKSIEYTLEFPIFGVGPAEFADYEGGHNKVIGTHGSFHGTHNTFTQVSAEMGFPGLIFYTLGLVFTFTIFGSLWRQAGRRPGCEDIRNVMLCILLGMIGFVVAITFLNFAYFFYQPLLGGIAVAASVVTKAEFERRDRLAALAPVPIANIFPGRPLRPAVSRTP